MRISWQVTRWRVMDYALGESRFLRGSASWVSLLVGLMLWRLGRRSSGLSAIAKAHASGGSVLAARVAQRFLGRLLAARNDDTAALATVCREVARSFAAGPRGRRWSADPRGLLGTRMLAVKAASADEKGVLVVDYGYVLPLLQHLFDIERVASRYDLVLEPSWSGFFTPEILGFATLREPVFVQATEPRDCAFIEWVGGNLVAVPTASNWWIDHRTAAPDPAVAKDAELIMVAAWAAYKRHWSFFDGIARLRATGRRCRVILVGYEQDMSLADVRAVANQLGVRHDVEYFENLTPAEVNQQVNRARAFVLWSRREGVNKAIVEAMLADVPVVVRAGFNYGYPYPYINPHTGVYATESTFSTVLADVLDNGARFAPRQWVLEHMTCQHATAILQDHIRAVTLRRGGQWTRDLVVRTKTLNRQCYWDEADRAAFTSDYEFLAACIRRRA